MMNKGGIAALMQQAQKMQERMQKAQAELATREIEGQSGAGMVKVTMTGKFGVKRVQIDPKLLTEDRDMLEDLVAASFNDAVHRVEQMTQEEMGNLTAGMGLPPGMKLPF